MKYGRMGSRMEYGRMGSRMENRRIGFRMEKWGNGSRMTHARGRRGVHRRVGTGQGEERPW